MSHIGVRRGSSRLLTIVPFVLAIALSPLMVPFGSALADGTYTASGTISFDSAPAVGAQITYNEQTTGSSGFATADSNGDHSIGNLPDGTYSAYLYYHGNGTTTPSYLQTSGHFSSPYIAGANVTNNLAFTVNAVTVTVKDNNGNLAQELPLPRVLTRRAHFQMQKATPSM